MNEIIYQIARWFYHIVNIFSSLISLLTLNLFHINLGLWYITRVVRWYSRKNDK